jgi:PAS domain-containing protein
VRLAVGGGRRPLSFWLLAGSIVPLLAADSLYGYGNLMGTWHEHNPADVGWILLYLGWGAAALHPSMRQLSEPSTTRDRPSSRRLVLVGSAALIPPVLLFVQQQMGAVNDAAAIAIASAVLFVMVLTRTAGLAGAVADRRSEARFRSLVNNALDAIVVVDNDGCIRFHTEATERVLGRDSAELAGRPLFDLLHRGDAHVLRSLLSVTVRAAWRRAHARPRGGLRRPPR